MKKLRYILEGIGILILLGFFRILGLDAASSFGGWMARTIGPILGAHKIAIRNLRRIFPDKSEEEIKKIALASWDNLGRVGGEMPYIHTEKMGRRIEVEGLEHVKQHINSGKPILFYSGHYGNWELCARVAKDLGLSIALIYRPANNPVVDKIMKMYRGNLYSAFYPKGAQGAREMIKALNNGIHLAMLVDQKMNDGIAVPFMGIPAMTAPAIAQFAYKYNAPMVACRITRLKGANFRATVFPTQNIDDGDRHAAIEKSMVEVNETLSSWIYNDPSQWLWMHNRWPRP